MSEKPLQDVIICCTSVTQEERSAIIRQAVEMGAVSQADLTSDVTHLIAARSQTEKYKFAARHRTDLKLMSVAWISACHAIWITGKDVNLPLMEEKYRLPVFHGLKVCVTNLDVGMRVQIEQLVTQNGGLYTGDLTKENTHLIAGSASGKKWEAVNSWQCDIRMVGIEWIFESVKRGASLDERYFKLGLSPDVRGQNSWYPARVVPGDSDAAELSFSNDKRRIPPAQQGQRKRLMKRASTLKDDGLWTEILKNDTSLEHSLQLPKDETSTELPTISLDLPSGLHNLNDTDLGQMSMNLLPEELTTGIFDGHCFYISGFPTRESSIVRQTVLSHGGEIKPQEVLGGLHVVPQNGNPPAQSEHVTMVTEFWIERCLAQHRFEEPAIHFTSMPFTSSLPIPRMQQLSICTSGFSAVESMHIEKLIRKVGAIYSDILTTGRSILLAASRDCRKYSLAKANGTRVIQVEWLWECIRRSKLVGVTEYALDGVLGSLCRIDSQVALQQRRSALLKDVVCYISKRDTDDFGKLCNIAESMGAVLALTKQERRITHHVGIAAGTAEPADGKAYQVSCDWLTDTYKLAIRQQEISYPPDAQNDENVPPDRKDASDDLIPIGGQQKLASEMNEIRKRINTGIVRRSSRKILGRATTLPCLDNAPAMMATNEDENHDVANLQRTASQGVTYSDPESMEKQRELMVKLGTRHGNGSGHDIPQLRVVRRTSSSTSSIASEGRPSMRAVGLGEVRKLRRITDIA